MYMFKYTHLCTWGRIPQVYTVDLSQLSFYYLCVSVCVTDVCVGGWEQRSTSGVSIALYLIFLRQALSLKLELTYLSDVGWPEGSTCPYIPSIVIADS